VSKSSDGSLLITAQFLGCDEAELKAALVSRVMQTPLAGRRGSAIMYTVIHSSLSDLPLTQLSCTVYAVIHSSLSDLPL